MGLIEPGDRLAKFQLTNFEIVARRQRVRLRLEQADQIGLSEREGTTAEFQALFGKAAAPFGLGGCGPGTFELQRGAGQLVFERETCRGGLDLGLGQ